METSCRSKRRRSVLTAGDKRDICRWKQSHPSANMNAILDWFHRERGIRIVKSTLSVILKESDAWLQVSSADASSMRKRSSELEALERSLVLWVESMTERKAVVSDMMLVEKARLLGPLQGKPLVHALILCSMRFVFVSVLVLMSYFLVF